MLSTWSGCSLHTQVVDFHIEMEIWLGQSLHIYISTGGHWMIMMIAYWLFKLIKSCTLWFVVDLWPIHSSLWQHEPKLIGRGYSHRRGANKNIFFVIRTAAVLHGGANKDYFPVIHTAAVRIRDLSQSFAPRFKSFEVVVWYHFFSELVCGISFFLNILILVFYPFYDYMSLMFW